MLRAALIAPLLVCAGFVGCKAKSPPKPEKKELGGVCRVAYECASLACVDKVCVKAGRGDGESCGMHAMCAPGLTCHPSKILDRLTHRDEGYEPSMSYGDVCKTEAGLAEIRRAEERELLIKSGAGRAEVEEAMKTVETAKRGAGAGLPVRVVRTEVVISDAIGHSFSACRADERLIGGSCGRTRGKGSAPLFQDAENGPTHYGDDDTVAARWRCNGMRGDTVVAKALCQRLPSP